MKWTNEMQTLGLTNETISQGLKTKIKDYHEMVDAIKELKESISNPSVNDDVDELQSDLAELENVLEDLDDTIVKSLHTFNKNKDKYAELGKKMAEGREKKKQAKTQPKVEQSVQVQAQPQVQAKPQVQAQPVETKTEEDKKKGNWGLFFGALALGIVTFGLYKSREQ